ncbi:hypothetical protein [Emergencia timonensis]|uniref:hypothetical protein n=1 Tax=Emergencia timonensis TaxID=1776384 RepID=UPI00399486F2
MAGLMYPAYQKYYSAICNLKRFSIEKNFFDNISSLDNFFSEYRSVTLVMQKSLAHTQYIEIYKKVSAGIWDQFFNDQRVKAIHTHPVEFIKVIDITVYSPSVGTTVSSQAFTVENDVPLSDLINSLKSHFKEINPIEVFFSAKFSFVEKDSGVDLWNKLITGLKIMRKFMDTMYSEIGEICPLCEKLRTEIDRAEFSESVKDILLVADYAYYPEQESFERAGRIAMFFPPKVDCEIGRHSIDSFMSSPYLNYENSAFNKFVLMNAVIGNSDLMPTIMTVYKDGTYELDTFHADIKTTLYRKINETAERILYNEVKEVFMMITYVWVDYDEGLMKLTSKERLAKGTHEYLAFMKVDCNLIEEEYVFDSKYIRQIEYIAHQMRYGKHDKLDLGSVNLTPIVESFKARKITNNP